MNIEEARAIHANHRKVGTFALSTEERLLAKKASDFISEWSLENDPVYRRRFNQTYCQMASDLGRSDLITARFGKV